MPKKPKPNFTPQHQKRSGSQSPQPKPAAPSKGQDSRKVHDAKGRNTHGRRAVSSAFVGRVAEGWRVRAAGSGALRRASAVVPQS